MSSVLPPDQPNQNSGGFSFLMLLATVSAIWLTGGLEQGAEGLFLVISGMAICCFRPQVIIEKKLWLLAGMLILCSSLTLFPLLKLTHHAWRHSFLGLPVDLGNLITPVPRETFFWLGIITVSAVIFLFALSQPIGSRTLLGLTVAGALSCAAYAALSIYSLKTGWKFPYDTDATFGFFPNRNHTANFLVTGCMLALGLLGVMRERRHWLAGGIGAISLAICGTSLIIYSESRGGIVFLIFGMFLWVCGLGRSRWSKPLVVSFAALFLGGMILFLVSKGEARNRLLSQIGFGVTLPPNLGSKEGAAQDITLDGRIQIYRDTWQMIQDAPLTGVGLGAYRYIYPHYSEFSLSESTSVHPESDWVMLAAEAGIPALIVSGVALIVLLARLRSERDHPYWPLRWGIVCGVLAALMHGWVDVPLHRVSLGWWILILAGLGFQKFPVNPRRPPLWQHLVLGSGGILSLSVGILLIRAEWFGGPSMPPFAASKGQAQITALYNEGKFEKAADLAEAEIKHSPMAHDLYFWKGLSKLHFEDTDAEVDGLFAAQRAFNPNWPQISIHQGLAWINIDPARTASLWQDALERKRRIEKAQNHSGDALLPFYANLLSQSGGHSDLQHRLLAANRADFKMVLIWLEQAEKSVVAEEIPSLMQNEKFLSALTGKDRQRFLQAWYDRADRASLFAFLEMRPAWKDDAWPFQIRRMVDARQFQDAVQAVAARHSISLSLETLLSAQTASPIGESENPLSHFVYYSRAGNEITARRLLVEACATAEPSPKTPPDVWRLAAILEIRDQRWEAAWQMLRRYCHESGVDASI